MRTNVYIDQLYFQLQFLLILFNLYLLLRLRVLENPFGFKVTDDVMQIPIFIEK